MVTGLTHTNLVALAGPPVDDAALASRVQAWRDNVPYAAARLQPLGRPPGSASGSPRRQRGPSPQTVAMIRFVVGAMDGITQGQPGAAEAQAIAVVLAIAGGVANHRDNDNDPDLGEDPLDVVRRVVAELTFVDYLVGNLPPSVGDDLRPFENVIDQIKRLSTTPLLSSAPSDVPLTSLRREGWLCFLDARYPHDDLPLSMLTDIAVDAAALPDEESQEVISRVVVRAEKWLNDQFNRVTATHGWLAESDDSDSNLESGQPGGYPSRKPIGSASVVLDAYLKFIDGLPEGFVSHPIVDEQEGHRLPLLLCQVPSPRPDQAALAIRCFRALHPDRAAYPYLRELANAAKTIPQRLAVDARLPILKLFLDGVEATFATGGGRSGTSSQLKKILGSVKAQHDKLLAATLASSASSWPELTASIARRSELARPDNLIERPSSLSDHSTHLGDDDRLIDEWPAHLGPPPGAYASVPTDSRVVDDSATATLSTTDDRSSDA